MFVGYNVDMDGYTFHSDGEYERKLAAQKKKIRATIEKYKTVEGDLDVEKIVKDWFQSFEADIFISHSHRDEQQALAFAGWLYDRFRIKAFVDSAIWNYSDELLRLIDDKYCVLKKEPDKTYSYEQRNISTAHVHMILNGELMKMIDKCECLMFFNTPNSTTSTKDAIKNEQTHSAWIYSELLFSGMVRHKKLSDYRPVLIHKSCRFDERASVPKFDYNISTEHLKKIGYQELLLWGSKYESTDPHESLDHLYQMTQVLHNVLNE